MSEYWVSTPKYWCKFCSTYVRDTPNDKRNHEVTAKHQGGVQRSLRTIHKEQAIAEREKSRAKAEVERLNGVVAAGKPTSAKDTGLKLGETVQTKVKSTPAATAEERKRQMKQLADMGISIPQEYRPDMAMAGEWQTTRVRTLGENEDVKPDLAALNVGVRKRKLGEDEEEAEAVEGAIKKRLGWGKDLREYPGTTSEATGGVEDIEALLNAGSVHKPKVEEDARDVPAIKKEESEDIETTNTNIGTARSDAEDVPVKQEASVAAPVIFKKRKARIAKT